MRFLIIFLFFFAKTQTFSQKRDYKKYDKAIKLFQKKDLEKSKNLLFKIIEKNTEWDKPFILLSNIYIHIFLHN